MHIHPFNNNKAIVDMDDKKFPLNYFNIGIKLTIETSRLLRKSYNNNINNFNKINITKPSIKDLKKETIKVIKNIDQKNDIK